MPTASPQGTTDDRALTLARLRDVRLDAVGALLACIYALPSLTYPHGNDQALHWYVGQGLLAGELPYASAISGKPVGIFLVHALASLLFGNGQIAIRLLEIPTLLLSAWWVAALVRPPNAPRRDGDWGAACVLLFGVYYTFFDYWDTAHPELWEVALTLWAAHVATSQPSLVRRTVTCGALGGAAFMVKYPAAIIALPVAIVCGLRAMALHPTWPRRLRALLHSAALYLLFFAIVFAACILPFAVTDTLEPMWEVLVTLLTRYAGQAPGQPVGPAWMKPVHGGGAPIAAGALLLAGLARAVASGGGALLLRGYFLLALTLSAFLSVILQSRYFPYHYVAAAPFMAACMLYGLHGLLGRRRAAVLGVAAVLVTAAFVAEPKWCTHPAISYRTHVRRTLGYLDGSISRKAFLTAFTGNNYLDHYGDHEEIGLEIRKRARPGDALCVRGFAPAIYQVAGLRCPSRLVMQPFPAGLPRWEIEFQRTIRKRRPRFLVTFSDRRHELRVYERLGYHGTPMPTLYTLLEHMPERNRRAPAKRPKRPRQRPPRAAPATAPPALAPEPAKAGHR